MINQWITNYSLAADQLTPRSFSLHLPSGRCLRPHERRAAPLESPGLRGIFGLDGCPGKPGFQRIVVFEAQVTFLLYSLWRTSCLPQKWPVGSGLGLRGALCAGRAKCHGWKVEILRAPLILSWHCIALFCFDFSIIPNTIIVWCSEDVSCGQHRAPTCKECPKLPGGICVLSFLYLYLYLYGVSQGGIKHIKP